MLVIDHVVLLAGTLAAAARTLSDEHGLTVVEGGKHLDLGTENAIVPLGSAYLELLTVTPDTKAPVNPVRSRVEELLDRGERFFGWVVRTDSFETEAQRLGLTCHEFTRFNSDGETLRWRLGMVPGSPQNASLPAVIQWDSPLQFYPGVGDGGRDLSEHGIEWIELGGPSSPVEDVMGRSSQVRFVPGEPGIRAVSVKTSQGSCVIR